MRGLGRGARALGWGLLTLILMAACRQAAPSRPSPGVSTASSPLTWKVLTEAPTPRTEVAAAAAGGQVYVIGGFVEGGATVNTVEIYDTRRDTWGIGIPLPIKVNHAMAVSNGETILVFGGYTGPGLEKPTDRAFVLIPETRHPDTPGPKGGYWQELARMPEPRAAGGAAVILGRIYVAGGIGPAGLADKMMVLDVPAAMSGTKTVAAWTTVPGVPTKREHLGVASDGKSVYVAGGRVDGNNLAAMEAFDPATGKWSTLEAMPTPRGGLAAAATSNGFILAVGGEAQATFKEAEAFNVKTGHWTAMPTLPTARHGLGVAALGTIVYVIAGGPQPGYSFSGANEAIDLSGP